MVGFLTAVRDGIRATQCGLLGFDEFVLGGVGRLSPGLRDVGLSTVNAYRRILGCPEAEDPEIAPPFSGGQCPITYQVTASGQTSNGPGTGSALVGGPIGGLTFEFNSFNNVFSVRVIGGNGNSVPLAGVSSLDPGQQSSWSINSAVPFPDPNVPNDCGDPDPIYPDPINRPVDIDITFEGDDGIEVTVPITVNYSPFEVNFNGDVRFPFTFDFGGVEFSGDVNFSPDLNVRINPPRLPPGSGEDFSESGEDEPGTTVPPAPPDQKIIGVVVTATTIQEGRVSSYSLPSLPPIYVPRLGSVKFVYSLGGATFFSSDIDVKDRRTFIECPFPGGADSVIASPQVGVDFSFVPIRGYPVATTNDIAALVDA